MPDMPLLRAVDAVTIRVPDIASGLAFYQDQLGHRLKWRNDAIGQAGLELPEDGSELVLTTQHNYEPNWLVESADAAVEYFRERDCQIVVEPADIPVGRLAVVLDPFGNQLVLLDLSKGTYATDVDGSVNGVSDVGVA